MPDQNEGMPSLSAQLTRLFATVPRPGSHDYWTNEDAAAAISAAGTAISPGYLSQLRTGRRDNPSARHLAAIARLFGVPLEYFFDPEVARRIDADLKLLAAIRDAGVQGLALRAQGLSQKSLEGLAAIVERIRQLEQLPNDDAEP